VSVEFALPDLGEGLADAEIVQWLVAEGDTVTLNQTLAEVETAKAIVELPSPHAGVVSRLHAAAGDTVDVGAPLVTFDAAVEAASDAVPAEPAPVDSAPAEPAVGGEAAASVDADADTDADDEHEDAAPRPNLVGYGALARSGARPQRRPRRVREVAEVDTAVLDAAPHDAHVSSQVDDGPLERLRSTPPVRRHAKELGVELALVAAAGATGVITRADVDAFAARVGASAPAGPGPAVAPALAAASDRHVPVRGVRKRTAEAMVRSAFTAPHVTMFHTVDVTATTAFVASLRDDRALAGHRIGVMAVVAKAVCLALGATPSLNATWDESGEEIVEHAAVHLGIAAATDRGLVVPVVHDAGRLGLVALADAIGDLTRTARDGRTTPAGFAGGTFTISNVGVFGVEAGTPILTPGQSGILAVGAVQRRPWEWQGEVALRDVVTLSLSFDHRVVDGEQGARFLTDVGGVLTEPGRAMLLG